MTREGLYKRIREKKSYLCVGLDADLSKIPVHLLTYEDPIFEFNKLIIEATKDLCVAYKPNLAFFEALGARGLESFQRTVNAIPKTHLVIADAKRGDIGNTGKLYARAFFETFACDAVTISPYMGKDSIEPFLAYPGKWAVVLALTSNDGSQDFQQVALQPHGERLFEKVLQTAVAIGTPNNTMFVVGATHPEDMETIRLHAPEHFLLVPGVGAQGGDLEAISMKGFNDHVGLLVNVSRSIIYASDDLYFDHDARSAAKKIQRQMAKLLDENEAMFASLS